MQIEALRSPYRAFDAGLIALWSRRLMRCLSHAPEMWSCELAATNSYTDLVSALRFRRLRVNRGWTVCCGHPIRVGKVVLH